MLTIYLQAQGRVTNMDQNTDQENGKVYCETPYTALYLPNNSLMRSNMERSLRHQLGA